MKYLILNFSDAKLFRRINKDNKNYGCKDYCFNPGGSYNKRDENFSFIEPITVHQISNMIHVLFNERPVPSLRYCAYDRNEYYFDKALNSYLKIDTPKISNDNSNYYSETTQVRKAVWNSWNPAITPNWELVRLYIDSKEKFDSFIDKVNLLLNIDSLSLSFLEVIGKIDKLQKNDRLSLYNHITNLKEISGLIYCLGFYKDNEFEEPKYSSITAKLNRSARTINFGVEKVVMLSGQIIVPVSDDDIIKLRKSKGCATILDGGLVYIDSVKNENNVDVTDFIPVKEISDKRATPALG